MVIFIILLHSREAPVLHYIIAISVCIFLIIFVSWIVWSNYLYSEEYLKGYTVYTLEKKQKDESLIKTN